MLINGLWGEIMELAFIANFCSVFLYIYARTFIITYLVNWKKASNAAITVMSQKASSHWSWLGHERSAHVFVLGILSLVCLNIDLNIFLSVCNIKIYEIYLLKEVCSCQKLIRITNTTYTHKTKVNKYWPKLFLGFSHSRTHPHTHTHSSYQ